MSTLSTHVGHLLPLGIYHKLLENEITYNAFLDTIKLRYDGMFFVIVTFPKFRFLNSVSRVARKCKTILIPQHQSVSATIIKYPRELIYKKNKLFLSHRFEGLSS